MNITFSCPGCGRQVSADEQFAGRRVRCKNCGHPFVIPPAEHPTEPESPAASHSGRSQAAMIGLGAVAGVVLLAAGGLSTWLWMSSSKKSANTPLPPSVQQLASAPPPAVLPPPPGMSPPPFPAPMPAPPPVISPDLAQLIGTPPDGSDAYPELPPASLAVIVGQGEPVRAALVASHVAPYRDALAEWEKIPAIFDNVHNAQDATAAVERLRAPLQAAVEKTQGLDRLEPLNRNELAEFSRQIADQARAVSDRLHQVWDRVAHLPGLERDTFRKLLALEAGQKGLDEVAKLGQPDPDLDHYVEVFISNVPDAQASQRLADQLKAITDTPAQSGRESNYKPQAHKASYRVWPVADRDAFARKIDFGQARVSGRILFVVAGPLENPAPPHAENAPAPAPAVPPVRVPRSPIDSERIADALKQLGSPQTTDRRAGLQTLNRIGPDEPHQAEILKAASALALDPDPGTATDALRVLGRWHDDDTARVLIQVVETSKESRVRREAIDQLGHLKATEAAEVIAQRLAEDYPSTMLALRQFGPEAEPAVIARLRDPDGQVRRYACQILRSIGGQASYNALKELPPDPDSAVQRDIQGALRSISLRIRPRPGSGPADLAPNP